MHTLPSTFELLFARDTVTFRGCLALFPAATHPHAPTQSYRPYLTRQEAHILSTYVSAGRQFTYMAGRLCAKAALQQYVGPPYRYQDFFIDKGIFDYPLVVHQTPVSNLQVGISHCERVIGALAYSDHHPVGLDIECLNPHIRQFKEEIITAAERRLMDALPGDTTRYYTSLWAAKEALSKILRTGLMTPFRLLEVGRLTVKPWGIEYLFENFPQYKSIVFLTETCLYALALPRKTTLVGEAQLAASLRAYCLESGVGQRINTPVTSLV